MNGYRFLVSCPLCASPIRPVTEGAANGWSTRAIARCTSCQTTLVIGVTVVVDRESAAPKPLGSKMSRDASHGPVTVRGKEVSVT